ncbi:MAG TPA: ATP-dependent metallopeptidase FtsH/Yme1/Tma family protein, partial [Coriobacteriia bacterium]|nr:ATP-dependent metallopeptidase FtsH/Yme1/Tma family protein [Coriobacteriia bacterium]
MNKNFRTVLIYLILLGVLVWVVMTQLSTGQGGIEEITTSTFVTAAEDGRIDNVKYVLRDGSLEGEYWKTAEAKTGKQDTTQFESTWAGDDSFTEFAEAQNLNYTVDNSGPSPWITIITSVLPILLLVFVMFFFLNQMQGGNSKIVYFGKAKAKRMTRDQPRITFKDVAGADEAIE